MIDSNVCSRGNDSVNGILLKNEKNVIRVSKNCPDPWHFWRETLQNPKRVLAPMVDHSEESFRLLVQSYRCDLAYTPMLHARLFAEDVKYRQRHFTKHFNEKKVPLFLHFCANDPNVAVAAVKAAQKMENAQMFDAVDLNLGCPQGIARKGHYGSFLLQEPDLVCRIIRAIDTETNYPVTVKIRVVDNCPEGSTTIELAKRLQNAGAAVLCIHGRTKEMKSQHTGVCDWEVIRRVKEALDIPVIGNGGVETYEDAERLQEFTKVDAVMSSIAALEYPPIFLRPIEIEKGIDNTNLDADNDRLSIIKFPITNINCNTISSANSSSMGSQRIDPKKLIVTSDICIKYLQFCVMCKTEIKIIKSHLFKLLHSWLNCLRPDFRQKLGMVKTLEDIKSNILDQLLLDEKENKWNGQLGYYRRYRKKQDDVREGKKKKHDASNLKREYETNDENSLNPLMKRIKSSA